MSGGAAAIPVDLWVWGLDVDDAERSRLAALLSEDEAARAARFVFDRDRHRFIAARGQLREILGEVTGRAAASLTFTYASHGKPALIDAPGLFFNLSHSEGLAALGVSRAGELGVDVEHERALKENVAERFFSERENNVLRALPEGEQLAAFYRCWTRKEAMVKAVGEGLSIPLDSFDVTLAPGAPAHVERFAGEADARVWALAAFDPAPGFAGAVAARTGGASLQLVWREKWRMG